MKPRLSDLSPKRLPQPINQVHAVESLIPLEKHLGQKRPEPESESARCAVEFRKRCCGCFVNSPKRSCPPRGRITRHAFSQHVSGRVSRVGGTRTGNRDRLSEGSPGPVDSRER